MRFTIGLAPLDPAALAAELQNVRAGALVVFEGWARDHHDGRGVERLEYEAFPEMAVATGEEILRQAIARFAVLDARAAHRLGHIDVGERAVWVGVVAEHRQEAFLACRWIMERLKEEVPIWKKEFFQTGEAGWVRATTSNARKPDDPALDPRYARQVQVPGIGPNGQRKLAAGRVLIVGAGGLGCPAMLYLAAAGVGTLTICDGDRVDQSNLHRQVLFCAADLGRNKAEAATDRLRVFHPGIALRAVADAATARTLPDLLREQDAVLDCTDSFESKYAIHDAACRAGVPLVQAAIYQFDGWVQTIDLRRPAGCFRCLWPSSPPVGCIGNCAEAGVLGVTPGLLGIHQVTETLKLLLDLPDRLDDATLYVDVLSGATRRLPRPPRRQDCPCGGRTPWPMATPNLLYPGTDAERLLREATIIDLREPRERVGAAEWIRALPNVPRAEWADISARFAQRRPLVLACATGIRSRQCLAELGHPPNIYAWTRDIHELITHLCRVPSGL